MKKILLILFGLLFVSGAYSAQIANVEYVHKMIEQTWDITVPYNSALNSVKQIANMKYLLSAIDVANHMLNGSATTDYGNGEFATLQATDTDTVNTAVETLVTDNGGRNYKFFITTTSNTTSFKFYLSAAGEFYVDWGDGTRNKITRTNTQELEYSHNYSTAGTYTIKIGGKATAYNTSSNIAAISFSNTINYQYAYNIASIDGSLGAIFGTLSDGSQPRFHSTFLNASNMTGSIPANLFTGISGAPASSMFESTFSGCTGLTSIPDGLFAGISGAPAYAMFGYTFSDCRGLTSIPENLFTGISGAPASSMFYGTFSGCSGLTSIPDGLFAGISGAPADRMFSSTFSGCSGLTSIPENLFTGISGAPAESMFSNTFNGCRGLTSIPAGLFAGISGAPAPYMFSSTFDGCSKLTSIPAGLFAGISGEPEWNMFQETFSGCSGLTSIPENLFGNISGTAKDYMFYQTFTNCTSLTGPSARINGQYLYEIWPSATSGQVGDMYSGATGLDDYRCIPTVWGGGGENCSAPTAEFTLTTTPDTSGFSFNISAAGEFVVDWGDGTVKTITKSDTTNTTYSHNYGTANTYTIGLSGQATAYNTDESTAAISFYVGYNTSAKETNIKKIASIDGSLGAIFGTLADGTQPRFNGTFYNATNMTGSIPSDLFAGISGAPASNMFTYTFSDCSGLTSIPSDLFAGISGAPAESMFEGTFAYCSGLTGAIPDGLFGNLTGAPAEGMFYATFNGCSGLTGAIPDGLFGNLTGAPAQGMFYGTFEGCSGLTSIPENLFGNISGTAQDGMFSNTFSGCTSLTGPSARINGQYLYEIWPSVSGVYVGNMYAGCIGLSDYSSISYPWKPMSDNEPF